MAACAAAAHHDAALQPLGLQMVVDHPADARMQRRGRDVVAGQVALIDHARHAIAPPGIDRHRQAHDLKSLISRPGAARPGLQPVADDQSTSPRAR